MPTTPKKPSQPSQPSQGKVLVVSKEQRMEKWKERMKDNSEAIKEGRNFLNFAKSAYDPEETLKKIARELRPKYDIGGGKVSEEDAKIISKSLYDYGIEGSYSVVEIASERYQGMMANLKKEIVKEFDCQKYSELALVDILVNAYARNLMYSKKLLNTACMGHTTPGLNNFMAIMSKEVDRANRTFFSALEILKAIKQPGLKVNIKTNTAFVSQNQQFNNNNDKNETVEAK